MKNNYQNVKKMLQRYQSIPESIRKLLISKSHLLDSELQDCSNEYSLPKWNKNTLELLHMSYDFFERMYGVMESNKVLEFLAHPDHREFPKIKVTT